MEHQHFAFLDGFVDSDLVPNPNLPLSTNLYRFEEVDGGTRAVFTGTYETAEGCRPDDGRPASPWRKPCSATTTRSRRSQ